MTNNCYDATGVLILDKVTPVITAIFGSFNLDATYPGEGRAFITSVTENSDPDWDMIYERLVELAGNLGVLPVEEDARSIDTVLMALDRHFRGETDDGFDNFVEHHDFFNEPHDFGDFAGLDALFLLATLLDDGHNLKAIAFEGRWRRSKPHLSEFGGNVCFISKPVRHHAYSSQILELSEELMQALLRDDLDAAGVAIANQAIRLLAGITDPETRTTLRMLVAEHLLQLPPPAR